MHPHIGIVRTERRSDGLSMITYDSNTLTYQSSVTNDAQRDPLLGLTIWNLDGHGPAYVYLYDYVYSPVRCHDHHEQQTSCHYIINPPILAYYLPLRAPSLASAVLHNSTVTTQSDSTFSMRFDSVFPVGF